MIYFDLRELALSCLYAFLFGVLTAGVYASFYQLGTYLRLILLSPIDALKSGSPRQHKTVTPNAATRRGIGREVFDLIFFTAAGIACILLIYLSLDGIPRIHFFILSLLGFILSRATLKRFFTWIIGTVLSRLNALIYALVFVILTPLRLLLRLLKRALSPLTAKLRATARARRYKRLLRRKIRKTKIIINKLFNTANNFF